MAPVRPVKIDNELYYNLEVRHLLQTGDVLCFRGAKWSSRLIESVEGGFYSHAAMVLRWNHRIMVAQAEWPRLEAVPTSQAIEKYTGQVDWYRIKDEHAKGFQTESFIDEAMRLLGTEFAVTDLIRVGFYNLLHLPVPNEPKAEREKDFFCSEYVAHCFRKAGLPLVETTNNMAVTPDAVAKSPVLSPVASIHWDPKNRDEALKRAPLTDEEVRASRSTLVPRTAA